MCGATGGGGGGNGRKQRERSGHYGTGGIRDEDVLADRGGRTVPVGSDCKKPAISFPQP